jgi:hypothetical protein
MQPTVQLINDARAPTIMIVNKRGDEMNTAADLCDRAIAIFCTYLNRADDERDEFDARDFVTRVQFEHDDPTNPQRVIGMFAIGDETSILYVYADRTSNEIALIMQQFDLTFSTIYTTQTQRLDDEHTLRA